MRRLINNIISTIVTIIRLTMIKLFHFSNFKFRGIERFSPNVGFEVKRKAYVDLGKGISVHSGSRIYARAGATLLIGDRVKMNYNCIVVCRDKIYIGAGTEFGPSVYVYDHDHDFRAYGGLSANKYKTESIHIGKNVWIGANTVILRGTVIGDNSVVGAGSVVKGSFPENSVIIQKRFTEIKNNNL